MTYIDLINSFWNTRRRERFSSNEADLYFFLLNECNIRGWENPFECTNGLITSTIGFTEKTLIEVRNRLQQKGLISFEKGQRKAKSPIYTILNCKKVSKTESIKVSKTESIKVSKTVNPYKSKTESSLLLVKEAKGDIDNDTVNTSSAREIFSYSDFEKLKAENEKLKSELEYAKKMPPNGPPKLLKDPDFSKIVYPWISDQFMESWNNYLKYRKAQHQFIYKSAISMQAALKKLAEDSDGSETVAIKMIEQSIASGWMGIFKIKKQNEQFSNDRDSRTARSIKRAREAEEIRAAREAGII